MPTFFNKRIKKRGGGTRLQRFKRLASGKVTFAKNVNTTSKPKNKKKRTSSVRKKGGNKRMGRKLTIPLALVGGLAAGTAVAIDRVMKGNIIGALDDVAFKYAGVAGVQGGNPHFVMEGLKQGLVPLIIGALIHKFVGGAPLNVNRVLASSGIPFIRI